MKSTFKYFTQVYYKFIDEFGETGVGIVHLYSEHFDELIEQIEFCFKHLDVSDVDIKHEEANIEQTI